MSVESAPRGTPDVAARGRVTVCGMGQTLDRCQRVREAASAIADRWPTPPRVGIILGSGLGGFAKQIDAAARIPYQDIPHFPRATALGHMGHLVCGDLAGTPVVAMEGRCHAYEGYSQAQITLPVRVMKELGIELLILSNASGGLNPLYAQGEVVVVTDHINLMLDGPLVGPHDEELGPRHVDMSRPYDAELIDGALEIARREKFAAHRGFYVGVKGPNLETRAEYRMLRFLGADVVGMSTVPEAIVAAQLGLRTLALATVTNVCRPDALRPARAEDIVAAAQSAEPKLRTIVLGIVREYAAGNRVPSGRSER